MAEAVERHWDDGPLEGLVVTRYGHGGECRRIEIVEAAHPVPDSAGLAAAQRILALARTLGPEDQVIALISGGGSALLTLPAEGISLQDKQAVNRALLASGANIHEMNCVRRHLSAIKGGRLGQACGLARLRTLVLSDVPGDDPATVASGPTLADRSTPSDALAILRRYRIALPAAVAALLERPPAPADSAPLGPREQLVVASARDALDSAARHLRTLGVAVSVLGDDLEGEARELGAAHAALALRASAQTRDDGQPRLILSGGETTVTLRGSGRGGRNLEYLLGFALAAEGHPSISALACDTDGIDGSEDNAGAFYGADSLARARAAGIDPAAALASNDAYAVFESSGDLVVTGPTRTNVNDFRAIFVEPT